LWRDCGSFAHEILTFEAELTVFKLSSLESGSLLLNSANQRHAPDKTAAHFASEVHVKKRTAVVLAAVVMGAMAAALAQGKPTTLTFYSSGDVNVKNL
jgi:hypothetical protein